jgi:nucleotide-binding universal stress UspA family protein
LPIDFSPSSTRAVELARSVAPHADIVLLHVFEVPFEQQLHYANVDESVIDRYRIDARQAALDRLHHTALETGLHAVGPRFSVLQGYPAARIAEQARELHCDLIVMGRRGSNALGELLVGSVTQRVLAESRCDVLVSV